MPSLQAFSLLVKAQQVLTAHLERLHDGGEAPDEAQPAAEAGSDVPPDHSTCRIFQVGMPFCTMC